MSKNPQSLRILKLLQSYNGNWCSLSELMDLRIASITRRISDLRQQGYDIRNKKETQEDGTIYSWYRLEMPKPYRETIPFDMSVAPEGKERSL